MLAAYPFLLLVAGGFLAGSSAVLLRRAASMLHDGLGAFSLLAGIASAAAFLAAFAWAWTISPDAAPTPPATIAGWLTMLAGGALAGWAFRVRGVGVLRSWRLDRFEQRQPFGTIRRPLELGLMIAVAGVCLLRPAAALWVLFASWLLVWNAVLELGEWELRRRLPACRDYLKRTPRYLPWRAARRAARRGIPQVPTS